MSEFDDIFTASSKEPEEVSVPPFDKDEWIQQKKAESCFLLQQMTEIYIEE